jgi:thiamine-monophosphate kinase
MGRLRDENSIIHKIEKAFPARGRGNLRLGLGDDAALWKPRRGCETILTCDWFLEGTHFLRNVHPAKSVGWKCLARAVSDIAAMGGEPRCFLVSLALPGGETGRWLDGFLRGLRRASRALDCELTGGDTTQSRHILINVTVVGEIAARGAILRAGARRGDFIYVSGRLGEAELGRRELIVRRGGARSKSVGVKKHLYPEPRLALGRWLAETGMASAMMDLSDGLSTDLPRLCVASGVGAVIEEAALPCVTTRNRAAALAMALHGGDDYELLFCVSEKKAQGLPKSYRGLRLTRIGKIVAERKIKLAKENGKEQALAAGGWDSFRE